MPWSVRFVEEDHAAVPGAVCPPVPDLAGGQGLVNAFAAITGIPGESANARHRNEIDLVSLS